MLILPTDSFEIRSKSGVRAMVEITVDTWSMKALGKRNGAGFEVQNCSETEFHVVQLRSIQKRLKKVEKVHGR